MSRDGVNSEAGTTRKGFPPATATELDGPPHESAPNLEASRTGAEGPDRNASVQIEELRVSQLIPFDSVLESKEAIDRVADNIRSAEPPTKGLEAPKLPRRPSHRDFVDLPEGSLVGEYEIERPIGEGGMGAVYSAVHPILGKRVAIKVIGDEISRDAGAIGRFRREARAVAQLASPHIVGVFGFGELADGRAYFVMEHLTGESLRERLARGRVPLDEALELLDQVARGLEVAHEAGIVHRDLKPENIFIERRRNAAPVVKLLDFGIVKLANNDDDVTKTQAGVLIGTPVYVAPEQIKAAGSVDHRADIYALGGVAFEMILGRVPFDRATVVELIAAHLECAPPQPRTLWPEIPSALDTLLFAMLAKDPAKRPTLGYFQESIEKVRRSASASGGLMGSLGAPATAPPSPPLAPAPLPVRHVPVAAVSYSPTRGLAIPQSRRGRYIAAIAGAVGLVLIVIAVAVTRGSDDADSNAIGHSAVVARDAGLRVVPIETLAPATAIPDAVAPPKVTPTPIAKPEPATAHVQPTSRVTLPPEPINPHTTSTPSKPVSTAAVTATSGTHATIEPPAPSPAPTTGELAVSTKPPCEITIDGKPTGHHTPFTGIVLEAGIHSVTFVNEKLGINVTERFQILPGKPVHLIRDYTTRLKPVDPNGTIDPFNKGSGHP